MTKLSGGDSKSTLYCSFCGKSQHEVRKLIAGPTVFICDECVELCNDIIREETKSALVSKKDGGVPTPQEICDVLDDYVIGQYRAKRVLSVAVHNHYKVVDGHGEYALGAVLADNVIVEHLADFCRCRHAIGGLDHRGLVLFADDVHAQLDAFITDEHGRPCDQLANLMLGFPAERAIKRVLGGFAVRCLFGHPVTPGGRAPPKPSVIV